MLPVHLLRWMQHAGVCMYVQSSSPAAHLAGCSYEQLPGSIAVWKVQRLNVDHSEVLLVIDAVVVGRHAKAAPELHTQAHRYARLPRRQRLRAPGMTYQGRGRRLACAIAERSLGCTCMRPASPVWLSTVLLVGVVPVGTLVKHRTTLLRLQSRSKAYITVRRIDCAVLCHV